MTAVAIKDIKKSENNEIKNIFQKKLGELVSIHINDIQISEFMTRGNSVDEGHVRHLMTVIEKEGYLPGSSVWVNAVTGADGEILHYRLIAGRHRYEACLRLGMKKIPTLIFQDLSEEEECIADRLSNQKDNRHKKVSYLQEAMHCLHLKQEKDWSVRQIARVKGLSKSAISRKIQVAALPKSVQDIFMAVPNGTPEIPESHLQNICKLKAEPHQILLSKKLINHSANTSENTKKSERKPIDTAEVQKTIKHLLILEAQGQIAAEAMKYIRDERVQNIDSISIVTEDTTAIAETAEDAWQQTIEKIYIKEAESREKGMRYLTTPMWLPHCMAKSDLCLSSFYLLEKLIAGDLRFKPAKDSYFFIHNGDCYESTEDYLAAITNVKKRTLTRKLLPSLTDYISFRKPGDVLKLKVNWNKLFELYLKQADKIPFAEGGLSGIPEGYNGKIQPTPYHSIYIENGQVKQVDIPEKEITEKKTPAPETEKKEIQPKSPEKKPQQTQEVKVAVKEEPVADIKLEEQIAEPEPEVQTESPTEEAIEVSNILREIGMGEKQITFCVAKSIIETTIDVIKYIKEIPPAQREGINNLPAYIFKTVRDGFKPPPGFVPHREVQEKATKKRAVEEVATVVRQSFEAGEKIFFCPKDGVAFPIIGVSESNTFTYNKGKKGLLGSSFHEWPDLNFFGVANE